MRNLNECQAEVFRRSEKRIKERKQRRNHILMACIPLVLCITIFGAFVFPGMDSRNRAPESSDELYFGAMGTDAAAGLFVGSVEVSGNGISHYYTSVEDVQGIISLLNKIVAIPETNDGSGTDNGVAEDSASTDLKENYNDKGYKIIVKRSDGSIAEYLLVGSLLIDQTAEEEFHMGEDTCKDLKEALGIPLK